MWAHCIQLATILQSLFAKTAYEQIHAATRAHTHSIRHRYWRGTKTAQKALLAQFCAANANEAEKVELLQIAPNQIRDIERKLFQFHTCTHKQESGTRARFLHSLCQSTVLSRPKLALYKCWMQLPTNDQLAGNTHQYRIISSQPSIASLSVNQNVQHQSIDLCAFQFFVLELLKNKNDKKHSFSIPKKNSVLPKYCWPSDEPNHRRMSWTNKIWIFFGFVSESEFLCSWVHNFPRWFYRFLFTFIHQITKLKKPIFCSI